MQYLNKRQTIILMFSLGSLLLGKAALASDPTSSCATNDDNSTVTTCYFDLTNSPSTTSTYSPPSAVLNGGVFEVPDQNGSLGNTIVGTGVLDPFVRIQEQGNGSFKTDNVESGFNTSAPILKNTGILLDDHDNGGSNWNHAIRLSDIATVNVGGVDYYQFILDINEQGNDKNAGLSLDEFKVFYSGRNDLSVTSGDCNTGAGYSTCELANADGMAYNMDASPGGDASILMDYNNFSGSGYGVDLSALVPVSNFAQASPNDYIYLYSTFGATGGKCLAKGNQSSDCMTPDPTDPTGKGQSISNVPGHAGDLNMMADAGFEEWSIRKAVPEPETLGLMGLGILSLVIMRRRTKA